MTRLEALGCVGRYGWFNLGGKVHPRRYCRFVEVAGDGRYVKVDAAGMAQRWVEAKDAELHPGGTADLKPQGIPPR